MNKSHSGKKKKMPLEKEVSKSVSVLDGVMKKAERTFNSQFW